MPWLSAVTHSLRRRPLWAASAVYLLVLSVAVLRVVRRSPAPTTPRFSAESLAKLAPARARGHWQTLFDGARIQVSSYDVRRQHHPSFAIDGRERASLAEKWVSSPSDREPWVLVELAQPTNVREVRLAFAGLNEDPRYTMRRYTIECLRAHVASERLEVNDNGAALARHPLRCARAQAVRIRFAVEALPAARAVVRLYEVAVVGEGV